MANSLLDEANRAFVRLPFSSGLRSSSEGLLQVVQVLRNLRYASSQMQVVEGGLVVGQLAPDGALLDLTSRQLGFILKFQCWK